MGGWVQQHGGIPPEVGLLPERAGDLICNVRSNGIPRRRTLRVRLRHEVVCRQIVRDTEAGCLLHIVRPGRVHLLLRGVGIRRTSAGLIALLAVHLINEPAQSD